MTISLSGLDLSFLKDSPPAPRKAKKPRPQSKRSTAVPCPYFVSDISSFVAEAGDEPELISSRSQLREYEKKHDVIQYGDFKPGEITSKNEAKKAERERIAAQHFTPTGWGFDD